MVRILKSEMYINKLEIRNENHTCNSIQKLVVSIDL